MTIRCKFSSCVRGCEELAPYSIAEEIEVRQINRTSDQDLHALRSRSADDKCKTSLPFSGSLLGATMGLFVLMFNVFVSN